MWRADRCLRDRAGSSYYWSDGEHNPLAHELIAASEQSGDRAWAYRWVTSIRNNWSPILPIWRHWRSSWWGDYRRLLPVTLYCKYNWAHLDIAGTAWRSGKAKAQPVVR